MVTPEVLPELEPETNLGCAVKAVDVSENELETSCTDFRNFPNRRTRTALRNKTDELSNGYKMYGRAVFAETDSTPYQKITMLAAIWAAGVQKRRFAMNQIANITLFPPPCRYQEMLRANEDRLAVLPNEEVLDAYMRDISAALNTDMERFQAQFYVPENEFKVHLTVGLAVGSLAAAAVLFWPRHKQA